MFTGIIETLGTVRSIRQDQSNLEFEIVSDITPELKIDQSVAHDGVCLTVTSISGKAYTVQAIQETLDRTNLKGIQKGGQINLERCLAANGRLDGHIVQGHVDQVAYCQSIKDVNGSWVFTFVFKEALKGVLIEKGSVCINGVSLTVVSVTDDAFSVAIIPYTYEHTNFQNLSEGSAVNIEFDVLGKYVEALLSRKQPDSD